MAKLIRKRARSKKSTKERILSYRNCAVGQIVLVPAEKGTEKWLLEIVQTTHALKMDGMNYNLMYKIHAQCPGNSNHIGFVGTANGSKNIDDDPFGGQGARLVSKEEAKIWMEAWTPKITFNFIGNPFIANTNYYITS